tara:strand:- start:71 stop:988 length:918 start_codon:yes stop_codon:yes gene_type:complete
MNPQFPIYIPSKGRAKIKLTADYLDYCKVPYRLVIEPSQYKMYLREVKDKKKLLPLDMKYKENYDCLDNYGLNKSTGPGPARNFIWDHSISEGYAWHWTMDDNIRSFLRFHRNARIRVSNGGIFRAMEDFCLRYENIAMAGPNYYMFIADKVKHPPLIFNTRIYSCNLIRNDVPFRWRGRYNEDTILSLDMLVKNWCTVQFNAFLQQKTPTQMLKGGNTDEFYHKEGKRKLGEKYADTGTLAKSQMQVRIYPQFSKVVHKFGRIHHHVDYTPFKKNKLIRKKSWTPKNKPNEYGMKLHKKDKNGS